MAGRKKVQTMKDDKTIFTIMLVALLTLSAYFLADTVDALIGRSLEAAQLPATAARQESISFEPRRELSDYTSILDRGLFGEGKRGSSATQAAPATMYQLIGTVEGAEFSGAVLEDASGQQNFYRIREKLQDQSMIVKVRRDKITMKGADGSTFELEVADDTRIVSVSKPGTPSPRHDRIKRVSEGNFVVDQGMVTSSTENLNQLLTQARALPYMENGKTVGFRMSEIMPGSLFEKIGLLNGDVIQGVNSQQLDDPGKFFQLYQGLKDEKSITIDVLRNGQRQTLNYDIR
ncbi:MAG: hypothetical protein A2X56_14720 [Nitrospirae bacterium GWC2_57_13]|jgi:general secretion pathway protein C|nr:MAG: hypothetical protein A2X56_14720 [Nitrospirae bacterium GWC2_57_13]HAS53130.1 hypothetical protein [Nitrospiraceae bacterium]